MKEIFHCSPFTQKMLLITSILLGIGTFSIYFMVVPILGATASSDQNSQSKPKVIGGNINVPACKIYKQSLVDNKVSERRYVVVGDIHGSYDGFLEILSKAQIIQPVSSMTSSSSADCRWVSDLSTPVTLVQVGDIVDRGPGASEVWHCLQHLQNTTTAPNKVVRLLGNHDIWWLQGRFHMRHQWADTQAKIETVVAAMKRDIMNRKLHVSHVVRVHDVPILFTHAGLHADFMKHLHQTIGSMTAEDIAKYLNGVLLDSTTACIDHGDCEYEDQVFEAGRDRGGAGIGGPLWTDFHTILNDFNRKNFQLPHFIQVVGHTASRCGADPDEVHCIRHAPSMAAVCVDGGMVYGSRSFLEIGTDGRFRAHQKAFEGEQWAVRDLTDEVCKFTAVEVPVANG